MSRFSPPDKEQRERQLTWLRDTFRGNCKCGAWLVVLPSFTESEPLVCTGPCHAGKKCGISYFVKGGELQVVKPQD